MRFCEKLARLNDLKDTNREFEFLGFEHTHMASHFSFFTVRDQASSCSNIQCPEFQEVKIDSSIPVVSDVAGRRNTFEGEICSWICDERNSPCRKPYYDITGVEESEIIWIENMKKNVTIPYCNGNRTHKSKQFHSSVGLPLLLPVNVEKSRFLANIPMCINIKDEYHYKLLGVTYQKRRSLHYGAILNANDMKICYDGIKSPCSYSYTNECMKDTDLQNCVYMLVNSI